MLSCSPAFFFALLGSRSKARLLSSLAWVSLCLAMAASAQPSSTSSTSATSATSSSSTLSPSLTTPLPPAPLGATPKGESHANTLKAARTMLILGDSLSAEYGLIKGQGWVALMEQRLKQENMPWGVINASISGETTSGGLARLPALLATHHPQLVVIELGANDALRGLDLKATQMNLLQMAQLIKSAKAKVLLMGIQVPPNYGQQYNDDLRATFAAVAKKTQSAFIPFFFQGLLDHLAQIHEKPESADTWFQADRIHPLAKAHPFLLQGIWPTLKKSLKEQD